MLTTAAFQSAMASSRNRSEISPDQLSSLLGGRKFNGELSENPFSPPEAEINYSEDDLKELQEYCSKMGIIGISFNGRNPKMILKMLKEKMGYNSSINEVSNKRELLRG